MARKFSDDNPTLSIIRHLILDILTISVKFHRRKVEPSWNLENSENK